MSNKNNSPLPQGGDLGEEATAESLGEDLGEVRFFSVQIAQNAEMSVDDFEYTPFNQEGGLLKERALFGKDLGNIIQELNGYLIA